MTSPEQDKILEALSAEHGAVKVLPLRGTDAVLACGWQFTVSPLSDPTFGGRTADSDEAEIVRLATFAGAWNLVDGQNWAGASRTEMIRVVLDAIAETAQPRPAGKWWYVPADPAAELSVAAGPSLRYAYEQEIADAHEQDAVRELLSAAGLR